MNNQITQQAALDRGIIEPIRTFYVQANSRKELALFVRMSKIEKPKTKKMMYRLMYYYHLLFLVN